MVKNILRKWLFPELNELAQTRNRVDSFFDEIEQAKKSLIVREKEGLVVNGCVIMLGTLNECIVHIKPELKPEIILSRLDFKSILEFPGSDNVVSNNLFTPVTVIDTKLSKTGIVQPDGLEQK